MNRSACVVIARQCLVLLAQRYTGSIARLVYAVILYPVCRLHFSPRRKLGAGESEESAANMLFECLFAVNRCLNCLIEYRSHENKSPCVEHFSQQRRYPLQGYQIRASHRVTAEKEGKRSVATENQQHHDWAIVGEGHRDGKIRVGSLVSTSTTRSTRSGQQDFRPRLQRGCICREGRAQTWKNAECVEKGRVFCR